MHSDTAFFGTTGNVVEETSTDLILNTILMSELSAIEVNLATRIEDYF